MELCFDINGENVCVHIRKYIYGNNATEHVAWASWVLVFENWLLVIAIELSRFESIRVIIVR